MSDEDVGAEVRAERRQWRTARGAPKAGSKVLLADFESAEELSYWSLRPRTGIQAWQGRQGVTSGRQSARLQFAPKTPAFAQSDFYLALSGEQKWDWTGATRLTVDCFNPESTALVFAVVVKSGGPAQGVSKVSSAEWTFTVPPKEKRRAQCPLAGKTLDLGRVQWVGFRVARREKRPTLLYLDKLVLSGSFAEKGE